MKLARGLALDIQHSENEGAHNLIGKVVSSKPISHIGLKNTMSMPWGYPKGFKVMAIGI